MGIGYWIRAHLSKPEYGGTHSPLSPEWRCEGGRSDGSDRSDAPSDRGDAPLRPEWRPLRPEWRPPQTGVTPPSHGCDGAGDAQVCADHRLPVEADGVAAGALHTDLADDAGVVGGHGAQPDVRGRAATHTDSAVGQMGRAGQTAQSVRWDGQDWERSWSDGTGRTDNAVGQMGRAGQPLSVSIYTGLKI